MVSSRKARPHVVRGLFQKKKGEEEEEGEEGEEEEEEEEETKTMFKSKRISCSISHWSAFK